MHKISDFIKTNKIFILIALIVLMSSFVALNLQYIGKNPFNSQINLDNPVKVCEGKDSFYFINSSHYQHTNYFKYLANKSSSSCPFNFSPIILLFPSKTKI